MTSPKIEKHLSKLSNAYFSNNSFVILFLYFDDILIADNNKKIKAQMHEYGQKINIIQE